MLEVEVVLVEILGNAADAGQTGIDKPAWPARVRAGVGTTVDDADVSAVSAEPAGAARAWT
jgi:hypothetical protein